MGPKVTIRTRGRAKARAATASTTRVARGGDAFDEGRQTSTASAPKKPISPNRASRRGRSRTRPGGKWGDVKIRSPSQYSLEELRSAKAAHAFLTEQVKGPEGFGECLRSFRFLLFFGIACIAEDKYPPLTRCWKELEPLFMHDPAFEDGVFIQSWILMDLGDRPREEKAAE